MANRKTRLAPTPSGFLHLGNLYSFLLTKRLAHDEGATVLLRIDDMDRQRSGPEFLEDIFDSLNYMGISWQEGPKDKNDFERNFSQTKRLAAYNNLLEKLVRSGKVFACCCSRMEIELSGNGIYPGTCKNKNLPLHDKDVCWRLDTSGAKEILLKPYQNTLKGHYLPESMRDFVIRKKDGFPAYQLCSVADDLYFGVDLIVRGEDLWASSLAQLFLAATAGETKFSETEFLHHPLLFGPDGKKLSKSSGDTSIRSMRKKGFSREDILNRLFELSGVDFTK